MNGRRQWPALASWLNQTAILNLFPFEQRLGRRAFNGNCSELICIRANTNGGEQRETKKIRTTEQIRKEKKKKTKQAASVARALLFFGLGANFTEASGFA